MKFKDKIMSHGFREIKCWWEVDEVGRWEWWKGNGVARFERQESGKVGGSWFYSRVWNAG